MTNHFIRRIKSSTPPYFRKISRIFKSIAFITATATGALYALPIEVTSQIPVGLLKFIGITVFSCTIMGLVMAELTTDDEEVQKEQYDK